MHNPTQMLELLTSLSLHYPQARYTNEELRILALDWADDLAEYPLDILREAAADVRRRERYFPGVATMIDYASGVMARRRAAMRELPPPPMTPEKMTRGAQLASLIRRKLDGDVEAGLEFDRLIGRVAGDVL